MAAALSITASTAFAARPTSRVSDPTPLAPTGPELERLIALYDHEPDYELQGDISAQVTTHIVYVKLAADEEWRTYWGSNAWTQAEASMETADDAMAAQFGINFTRYQTYTWDTYPDTSRNVCNILAELGTDTGGPAPADVTLGYSKNAGGGGGCADVPGDEAVVKYQSSSFARWAASQHEMSHLFGAPDRYPDPNNLHRDDVMEVPYSKPDFWCSQDGYEDYVIMTLNAGRFD